MEGGEEDGADSKLIEDIRKDRFICYGQKWGSYQTNINNLFGEIIGVARDTSERVNYAIGVLALDDNTLGGTSESVGRRCPFSLYYSFY
jgi:hypothetical protein